MAVNTLADPKYIPAAPGNNLPLGIQVPPELINHIYELVLADDVTATILPYSLPLVGACHCPDTGNSEHIIITSPCGLLRTCRASRNIYYSLLKDRVLSLQLDDLRVYVEDLNFEAFATGFLSPMLYATERTGTIGSRAFIQWPLEIKLTWSEDFLRNPCRQELDNWLESRQDDETTLPFSGMYKYIFDPVLIVHADRLRDFLNAFVLKREHVGPELRQLMSDFGQAWHSGRFVKEGMDVKCKGEWVGSEWVLQVVEAGGRTESDSQDRRDEEGAGDGFVGDVASTKRRKALQKREDARAAKAKKKALNRAKESRRR